MTSLNFSISAISSLMYLLCTVFGTSQERMRLVMRKKRDVFIVIFLSIQLCSFNLWYVCFWWHFYCCCKFDWLKFKDALRISHNFGLCIWCLIYLYKRWNWNFRQLSCWSTSCISRGWGVNQVSLGRATRNFLKNNAKMKI